MPKNKIISVVLAAGEGTRMKSDQPKVMHEIGGMPMIGHLIRSVQALGESESGIIIGPDHQKTVDYLNSLPNSPVSFIQNDRLGTAHAVNVGRNLWNVPDQYVLVLLGDAPLVTEDTLNQIVDQLDGGVDMVVVGFEAQDPTGYGRMNVENDQLRYIREHKDASEEERQITLCNAGVMGFNSNIMAALIDGIGNENAQNEYYLTDAVEVANAKGLQVRAVVAHETEMMGINDRVQLAQAEHVFQSRARERFMRQGVTLIDPSSAYFSADTQIGRDVLIEPNVVIKTGVVIHDGARILANSYLEDCEISTGCVIGPFARLRPGTVLEEKAKVGNFCEVKNARIAKGAKVNHLSYIGDAEVGNGANIGAGTITCNYDGFSKFKTTIGANVFVGSNSSLVAPVTLGEGAYIASGSVITTDVAPDALAIGRSRQVDKPERAKLIRSNRSKKG